MFPSGLEPTFRYEEFCANYKAMHLPQEVEEWLDFCLIQPSAALAPHALESSKRLLALPPPTTARSIHKQVDITGIASAAEPLQLMGRELGIEVPTIAVRAVAERPVLRQRVAVTLAEYSEQVKAHGSTPHRRWVINPQHHPQKENFSVLPSESREEQSLVPNSDDSIDITDPYPMQQLTTQPDEKSLVQLLTTMAAASARHGRADTASDLLNSALAFAHDDETAADVHANLSSAYTRDGRFHQAATHGKAAALRSRCPKAWANWAVATAYLDDFDEAARIVERGIHECADGSEPAQVPQILKTTAESIRKGMVGRTAVPEVMRGKRFHLPAQTRRGILEGTSEFFNNETDMVFRPGGGTLRECVRVQHEGTRQWAPYSTLLPGLPLDSYNGHRAR